MRKMVAARRESELRRLKLAELRQSRKDGNIQDRDILLAAIKKVMSSAANTDLTSVEQWFFPREVVRLGAHGYESGKIVRIDGKSMPPETFAKDFDIPRRPCILTNIVTSWPAFSKWSLANIQNEYGNEIIQCAQYSKGGNRIKMTITEFLNYMKHQVYFIY